MGGGGVGGVTNSDISRLYIEVIEVRVTCSAHSFTKRALVRLVSERLCRLFL